MRHSTQSLLMSHADRRRQSPRLKTSSRKKHKMQPKVATRLKTEHKKDWKPPDLLTMMMLSSSRIVAAAVGRSQTQTNRLFSLRATKAATSMPLSSSRVASAALGRSRVLARRWLSESKTGATETVAKETAAPAEFWGALGALAGWGMYVLLFVCCCSLFI
jgi:hypothetical protein